MARKRLTLSDAERALQSDPAAEPTPLEPVTTDPAPEPDPAPDPVPDLATAALQSADAAAMAVYAPPPAGPVPQPDTGPQAVMAALHQALAARTALCERNSALVGILNTIAFHMAAAEEIHGRMLARGRL